MVPPSKAAPTEKSWVERKKTLYKKCWELGELFEARGAVIFQRAGKLYLYDGWELDEDDDVFDILRNLVKSP